MKRAALLFALALPSLARADDSEARRYFDAGTSAFAQNHYDDAVRAFEEAYRLSNRPSVKFALAQACRFQFAASNDLAMARRSLALFRELLGELPDGARRSQTTQYINELEPAIQAAEAAHRIADATRPKTQLMLMSHTPGATATLDGGSEPSPSGAAADVTAGAHRLHVSAPGFAPQDVDGTAIDGRLVVVPVELAELSAHLTVTAPAGADIEIDGAPRGTAPLAHPLDVSAGTHFVAVMARGRRPWSREVSIGRGAATSLDAHLARTNQRRAAVYVLGAGGALAVAGGVASIFALRAEHHAQDLEAVLAGGTNLTGDQLAEHNDAVHSLDDRRTLSYVLYGAAAATLATGALLYLVDHQRAEPRSIVVAPVAAPNGASISVGGRF